MDASAAAATDGEPHVRRSPSSPLRAAAGGGGSSPPERRRRNGPPSPDASASSPAFADAAPAAAASSAPGGPWRRKPLWAVGLELDGPGDDGGDDGDGAGTEMVPMVAPPPSPSSRASPPSPPRSPSPPPSAGTDDVWSDNPPTAAASAPEDDDACHRPRTHRRRQQQREHRLRRHLTLTDLLSIGVGGTVGSGIFVLCGLIARRRAGPATSLSWLLSGLAASLSGTCYAELAGRIPSSGSTYVYAYVAIGEVAAVVSAALLTLEYGLSGAAVARSWGDKSVLWMRSMFGGADAGGAAARWVDAYLDPGYGLNPMAFLISSLTVAILLGGVRESKAVTNAFTLIKVVLVAFMAIAGLSLSRPENWAPFVPPEFGLLGVFRGATSSFFGFVGYDEVCCLSGEAVHPRRDMPRAVLLTIGSVSVLYVVAAVALTGMVPYVEISPDSGFPEAFRSRGVGWAAEITAFGELFTLPVVVLISLTAQPRLLQALAQDGLLPPLFGEVEGGNLRRGTLVAGTSMTLVATFVPFRYLDDLISSGILLAFSITDTSLVLMRQESPAESPHLLERLLFTFNVACFASVLLLSNCLGGVLGRTLAVFSCVVTVSLVRQIVRRCPRTKRFGGRRASSDDRTADDCGDDAYFKTPLVPYLPCTAIFFNWYLISQLEAFGMVLLLLYTGLAAAFYFFYGASHSHISRWDHSLCSDNCEEQTEQIMLLKSTSLSLRSPSECSPTQSG